MHACKDANGQESKLQESFELKKQESKNIKLRRQANKETKTKQANSQNVCKLKENQTSKQVERNQTRKQRCNYKNACNRRARKQERLLQESLPPQEEESRSKT